MSADCIAKAPVWDVRLPDRRPQAMGSAKPRATVVVCCDGGEERIYVPLVVGKLLRSKQKADEIHPASRKELLDAIDALARSCALTRVERLINRRDYSRKEVEDKLIADGYSRETIAQCVDYAIQIGLLSDMRYADVFIRSKIGAGWGMGRIERELGRRGIDVQQLVGWPYDYLDPEDELSRAIEVGSSRRASGPRAYEKLARFLCGRGFSIAVATKAASHILSDTGYGSRF